MRWSFAVPAPEVEPNLARREAVGYDFFMESKTAYVTHPACALHEMGEFHPERAARLAAIEKRLEAEGLLDVMERVEALPVAQADLALAHEERYLSHLKSVAPVSGRAFLDPDTSLNPSSLKAASLAAGGASLAVDLVLSGKIRRAFCNVRPPGHHAEASRAMGFCVYNNVAVAAMRALERHGLKKVLIVDFDVHHGNGTEDIFKDDPRVMLCSSFQHPFYPYSPLERIGSNPHVVKSPLDAGSGGDEMRRVVEETWLPLWEKFQPELVLVSAGFDAHEDDPLGGLKWREDDYAWITAVIAAFADRSAQGRVLSCLEGGYELDALGRSAARHVAGLLD